MVVAQGIERAQEVASLFEGAAHALDINITSLLSDLQPMNTPLEKYATHIGKFRAASRAAHAAAPTEVWTGLLLVDTAPVKASLAERAETAVNALLQQLLDKSAQTYEHVCVRCEVISHDVMQVATSTAGVLELKVGRGDGRRGRAENWGLTLLGTLRGSRVSIIQSCGNSTDAPLLTFALSVCPPIS